MCCEGENLKIQFFSDFKANRALLNNLINGGWIFKFNESSDEETEQVKNGFLKPCKAQR